MGSAGKRKVHTLPATPETVHTGFYDNSLPPVLTIDSGDVVILETMNLFDDQLTTGMTFEKLEKIKQPYADQNVGPHTLTGPVYINGAAAGDVLEIRIKRIIVIYTSCFFLMIYVQKVAAYFAPYVFRGYVLYFFIQHRSPIR